MVEQGDKTPCPFIITMAKKKYKQKPKIVVSEEVKKKLDEFGNKGDTYEDIISKLIGLHYVCWLCGTEDDLTKHHVEPGKSSKGINLCRKCHDKVEGIKTAIKVMEREKKISSPRQFRKILDNFKLKGGEGD